MRRKAGAGPHRVPGFVAAFFFFPPFLIFLAVGPSSQEGDTGLSYLPAARVGVASPRPPWLGWPPASEPAQRLPFLLPRGPRPLPGVLRPALASRLAGEEEGPWELGGPPLGGAQELGESREPAGGVLSGADVT